MTFQLLPYSKDIGQSCWVSPPESFVRKTCICLRSQLIEWEARAACKMNRCRALISAGTVCSRLMQTKRCAGCLSRQPTPCVLANIRERK